MGQLFHLLKSHVDACELGAVCVSPVDVVLDEAEALIVQPDIIYVSRQRLAIVRNQVWGAPDLVIEVLSAPNIAARRLSLRGTAAMVSAHTGSQTRTRAQSRFSTAEAPVFLRSVARKPSARPSFPVST